MAKLTKEQVLEVMRKCIFEANPWEYSQDKERANISFYVSGIVDMTTKILDLFDEAEKKNG